jgi:hypothetical protein
MDHLTLSVKRDGQHLSFILFPSRTCLLADSKPSAYLEVISATFVLWWRGVVLVAERAER